MLNSKPARKSKPYNLNKLCSKFEVDISRNELSVKFLYGRSIKFSPTDASKTQLVHTVLGFVIYSSVCHVFPPLVSIFGLFPVLDKCDYEFSLVQMWLSIILCIYFPVCSVWFHLVYSLLPGVSVCVYPAVSCPALFGYIKDCYLSYILVCVFLDPPSCMHHDA